MELKQKGKKHRIPVLIKNLLVHSNQRPKNRKMHSYQRFKKQAPSKNLIPVKVIKTYSVPNEAQGLKVIHLNAQSVGNKITLVNDFIVELDADIAFITETWLKP